MPGCLNTTGSLCRMTTWKRIFPACTWIPISRQTILTNVSIPVLQRSTQTTKYCLNKTTAALTFKSNNGPSAQIDLAQLIGKFDLKTYVFYIFPC